VSLFLDCPKDYVGIICPNATEIQNFKESVAKGWITWHAFPFNAEPEVLNQQSINFALRLTHDIDKMFGLSPKKVMSQRDVPGMTRSMIPLLKASGVDGISVGVNGGSSPPDVPKAFIWKDPVSGQQIRTFYLNGGYGGLNHIIPGYPFDWIAVPGSSDIMIVDWRGDNAGPPTSAQELITDFAQIEGEFPGAKVIPSTFDIFLDALSDIPDANFPILTEEIGDTWIHGVATDPLKLAQMRIMEREAANCISRGACTFSDKRFWEFYRFYLKNAEHTWGLDDKKTLTSYKNNSWSNKDLVTIVASDEGKRIIASWNRQRAMGIADALLALGTHPLRATIEKEFADLLDVKVPNTNGYTKYSPSQLPTSFAANGGIHIGFDPATGGLSSLSFDNGLTNWASPSNKLLYFEYQTYNQEDFANFLLSYNYMSFLYEFDDYYDFDKVNIDGGGAKHRVALPTLQSVWLKNSTTATNFIVEVTFPSDLNVLAGTPRQIWYNITVTSSQLFVEILFLSKAPTRLPEGMFLRFSPSSPSPNTWKMTKQGEEMDPLDVIVGGARHMHSISDYVSVTRGGKSLFVHAIDSSLVSFGAPTAFPTPTEEAPNLDQGAAVLVWDNIWNTNYPLWYPFNPEDANFKTRFILSEK